MINIFYVYKCYFWSNLYRTFLFKKLHFYFIKSLFLLWESDLQFHKDSPSNSGEHCLKDCNTKWVITILYIFPLSAFEGENSCSIWFISLNSLLLFFLDFFFQFMICFRHSAKFVYFKFFIQYLIWYVTNYISNSMDMRIWLSMPMT